MFYNLRSQLNEAIRERNIIDKEIQSTNKKLNLDVTNQEHLNYLDSLNQELARVNLQLNHLVDNH